MEEVNQVLNISKNSWFNPSFQIQSDQNMINEKSKPSTEKQQFIISRIGKRLIDL